ncbi:MAG: peptide deformylase [Gammaproteobacteria bacterium]
MAIRTVLTYPDPRLRVAAEPVDAFDDELIALAADLRDTLCTTPGIALSAPQLGVARQLVLIDLSESGQAPEYYVNPRILARSAWGFVSESCLSVPGVTASVLRATRLRVSASDLSNVPFERDVDGLRAVCLQHEIDHLAGKLFVERLGFLRRLLWQATAGRRARRGLNERPSLVESTSR